MYTMDDDTGLLSLSEKDVGRFAFLSHGPLGLDMARFPEAERRLLHEMICIETSFPTDPSVDNRLAACLPADW